MAAPAKKVDVIVVHDDSPGASESASGRGLGAEVRRSYRRLPMKSLRIPEHALDRLQRSRGVRFVALDSPVFHLSEAGRRTAREPAAGSPNAAFTGTGVTVAVIDSGVDDHRDFGVFDQYNFVGGAGGVLEEPTDPWGHGTHVAGIIAANGAGSSGRFSGLARDVNLVSLRVLSETGQGDSSDLLAAIDWILDNPQLDIRVVNMSLGKGIESAQAEDPLVIAVNTLWDSGIVVLCAAGNHGRDGNFSVGSPTRAK